MGKVNTAMRIVIFKTPNNIAASCYLIYHYKHLLPQYTNIRQKGGLFLQKKKGREKHDRRKNTLLKDSVEMMEIFRAMQKPEQMVAIAYAMGAAGKPFETLIREAWQGEQPKKTPFRGTVQMGEGLGMEFKLALIRVYSKKTKEPTIKLISSKEAICKFGEFGSWKTKDGMEQFIYSGDSEEMKERIDKIQEYDKKRQCQKNGTVSYPK